ncbi:MAG: STAS domain-containing protein [Candidatus Omnitrophica bacterium]|nr:STAS domain-containing protein [Candidatus Omnitrophota bacterium]
MVKEKEGVSILDVQGNLDINASRFVETVGWVLLHKNKDILCDFSSVNLVDYIGVSLIAVVYKNVVNHKGRIKFMHVPAHLQKLLTVAGMEHVLEIFYSEQDALRSFKEENLIHRILKKQLRRRFTRIPYQTTVSYGQKFAPRKTMHRGRILNLSGIGLFVVGGKVFSLGDILTCKLHLLPDPGFMEVDTKVVWVADREIQPLESPGMGLEFYNLSAPQQEKIVSFVEKHRTYNSARE